MLLRLKIVMRGEKNISINDEIVLCEKLCDVFFSFQLVKVKDRIRIFKFTSQKHVTTYQNNDSEDVFRMSDFCCTETPVDPRVFVKYHKWKSQIKLLLSFTGRRWTRSGRISASP